MTFHVSPLTKHQLWRRPIRKDVAGREQIDRLLRLNATITNRLRQAFLDAVDRLGEAIDTDAIVQALKEGRTADAINSVDPQLVIDNLAPIEAIEANSTPETIPASPSIIPDGSAQDVEYSDTPAGN